MNLDPSHFFWQGMDAIEVVRAVGDRIGHSHGKDTLDIPENKALQRDARRSLARARRPRCRGTSRPSAAAAT